MSYVPNLAQVLNLISVRWVGGQLVDDNETKVATLYGRIIIACLAILVALWQLDVTVPVI